MSGESMRVSRPVRRPGAVRVRGMVSWTSLVAVDGVQIGHLLEVMLTELSKELDVKERD